MCQRDISQIIQKIKVLVMDVDGTLTDGGIYMSDNGEMFKRFNIKDGYGIRHMLPELGIEPVILTGRESEIVLNRCRELDIKHVFQASSDKAESLNQIMDQLHVDASQIAYIGDDMNDLPAMENAGLRGCPADAVEEVKDLSDHITNADGGCGAVREFIEWIANSR